MGKLKTRLKSHWWAYLDDEGVIKVRKYISDWEIQKCEQMPFCKGIFDPFEADNKIHAQHKIIKFLEEQAFYEKKVN